MLSKETKQEVINQISERFKSNPSVFVLEYKGLTVKELENVRKELKQTNSELKIVKNTLLKKAAEDTDASQLNDLFVGSTAVAFCEDDSAAAAKVFVKSAKDYELLNIKGGLLEGKLVSLQEIETISKLPSRIELNCTVYGSFKFPNDKCFIFITKYANKILICFRSIKRKERKIILDKDLGGIIHG